MVWMHSGITFESVKEKWEDIKEIKRSENELFRLLNTIRGPQRTGEELLFAVSKTGKES